MFLTLVSPEMLELNLNPQLDGCKMEMEIIALDSMPYPVGAKIAPVVMD